MHFSDKTNRTKMNNTRFASKNLLTNEDGLLCKTKNVLKLPDRFSVVVFFFCRRWILLSPILMSSFLFWLASCIWPRLWLSKLLSLSAQISVHSANGKIYLYFTKLSHQWTETEIETIHERLRRNGNTI